MNIKKEERYSEDTIAAGVLATSSSIYTFAMKRKRATAILRKRIMKTGGSTTMLQTIAIATTPQLAIATARSIPQAHARRALSTA